MDDVSPQCVVSPGTAAIKASLPLKPPQQHWRNDDDGSDPPASTASASLAAALLRARGGSRCDSAVALPVDPRATRDAVRGDGAGTSAAELGEVFAYFVDALQKREAKGPVPTSQLASHMYPHPVFAIAAAA